MSLPPLVEKCRIAKAERDAAIKERDEAIQREIDITRRCLDAEEALKRMTDHRNRAVSTGVVARAGKAEAEQERDAAQEALREAWRTIRDQHSALLSGSFVAYTDIARRAVKTALVAVEAAATKAGIKVEE